MGDNYHGQVPLCHQATADRADAPAPDTHPDHGQLVHKCQLAGSCQVTGDLQTLLHSRRKSGETNRQLRDGLEFRHRSATLFGGRANISVVACAGVHQALTDVAARRHPDGADHPSDADVPTPIRCAADGGDPASLIAPASGFIPHFTFPAAPGRAERHFPAGGFPRSGLTDTQHFRPSHSSKETSLEAFASAKKMGQMIVDRR